MRSVLPKAMAALLLIQTVSASESVRTTTDWNGFQQQVTQRRLHNRTAWISLTTGDTVKVFFLRAAADGLVVQANRKTRQWTTKAGESMVPRDLVSAVRFTGRIGRGGLIGGLAGLGAGAGIAAAAAANGGSCCEGSTGGAVLLAIPALAGAGYLIGRAMGQPAPSFVIAR